MEKNYTTISTQYTEKKRKHGYRPRLLASLALLALLFLTMTNALAHTVTINVDTGGEWQYRIGSGDWLPSETTYYSETLSIEVENNARLYLRARNTDAHSYEFTGWYEGDTKVSGSTSFSMRITYNRNFTAKFVQLPTFTESTTLYVVTAEGQDNGDGTYKFYLLNENVNPADYDFSGLTPYDYIDKYVINGGGVANPLGSGIHVKFVFNTSQPVGIVGYFKVIDGILEMCLGDFYTNTTGITLKKTGGWNLGLPYSMFINLMHDGFDYNNIEKSLDAQKIIVRGTNNGTNSFFDDTKQFVIDGGCVPYVTETGEGTVDATYSISYSDNSHIGHNQCFRAQCGTMSLTNVTIQNFCTTANGIVSIIRSYSAQECKSSVKVDLEHCWLDHNVGTYQGVYLSYGTIYKYTGNSAPPTVTIKNSKFSYSYSSKINNPEPAIRGISGSLCNLVMENCTVEYNYGRGVRWQSTNACTARFTNCTIRGNKTFGKQEGTNPDAIGSGGGMLIKSRAYLSGCIIENNWAPRSGGGIYFSTFEEGSGVSNKHFPEHGILSLDEEENTGNKTIIRNNTALDNGGGVAMMGYVMPTAPYYGYTNGEQDGQYTMTFNMNGATVENNTAGGSGGGVYISRNENATFYKNTCNLNYGTIQNNTAANGNGGGVAIVSTSNYIIGDTIPVDIDPQDIDVVIGVAGEASKTMLIQNNTAKKGAGVYVETYPITYTQPGTSDVTSTVNTTVYDYTQVNNNTADTLGGGLYVEKGDVSILRVGSKSPAFTQNTATKGSGGGLYLNEGSILLRGTTIGGSSGNGNTAGQSGGGIYTKAGDILINPDEDEGIATTISHNTANANGGGVCTNQGTVEVLGNRSTGAKVQITDNTATNGSGGGIFCMGDPGNTGIIVRLRRVNLSSNTASAGTGTSEYTIGGNTYTVTNGSGGGLYLQQGLIGISYADIGNNVANINGGGINNHSGSIFLMQSTVDGNSTTTGSGGGIYTYSGDIFVNQQQDGTPFDETTATRITNNTAKVNGGGLNTHSGYIKMHGTDDATRIQVTGNTATTGSGGGIFCMGSGSSSTEYINVMHADITGNAATNGGGDAGTGVTAGCGGGIYLQKGVINITDVNLQSNTAKVNGGGINNHSGSINVRGCRIGGSAGNGNSAEGNGGGIYTVSGDIDIEDHTITEGGFKRYQSKVTHNTAGGNGGGLNTHSGTITINNDQDDDEIEVTHNTAGYGGGMYAYQGTIVSHNALINSNTATSGNGGGINNHSGDIFIYGGQLSNNTAPQGNGGGAYTNAGDIDILYFPFSGSYADTLHGTVIYNNLARYNGGGINNHTGRVDVRYATLRNNTATLGNGGGIYCNGPHASSTGKTIRLLRTIIEGNKTTGADGTPSDPTGRGGGIYLKYGSIFAQGSLIRNNSANVNGGGLDNHDGDIRVFGCNISGNTAVTGKGGGIYTQTGDITTGPCSVHRASQITNNTAYINGGGINNHEGDILLNGDLISGNTAVTGNGGGVYIANGTINMYGGRIAANAASGGRGGGVYSGGGTFNIQERQELPVVEVIDAIPGPTEGGYPSDTIHYHVIFAKEATSTHEHGFKYAEKGSSMPPVSVQVSNADLTPDCYKYRLTGLAQAKTYWVVAYATNDIGTAVSDTAWFTTLSATFPTVFTGSHASVTASSAQINGKVLDKGGSDITGCGIEYSTDQSVWMPVPNSDHSATFFTVTASGLSPNTTYYYRAYATNGTGPAYGEIGSFKTAKNTPNINGNMVDVSAIGSNTATFTFTIPAQSGVQCCGFVWSTDDDPELTEDHSVQCTVPASLATADGTITATPTNLDPATTYYVRAYVSFEAYDHGTDPTNYTLSTPKQFVTHNTGGLPTVHSVAASETTQHSLVATGQVIYGPITARGYCYSTDGSTDPSTWTQVGPYSGSAGETDEYEVAISGLTAGTTYYLCAYATNEAGTVYGNHFNVTTLPVTIPEVVIFSIDTEIVSGTANATITCTVDDGGGTIDPSGTSYGVTYSPNSDMSVATTTYGTNLSGGTFSVTLSGLTKNATYYVQAFANNEVGTHTTHKVSFTTPYDPFTITLTSINPVGSNTATANATVTPASNNIKTYGVCWSTHSPAKRTATAAIDQNYYDVYFDLTGVDAETDYSHAFVPAYPNTKYYARAYASVESSGSHTGGSLATLDYSGQVEFLTLPAMVTGAADNVTKGTATLTGTIASTDPHHYLEEYGFCWGTAANPTVVPGSYLSETIAAANSSTHSFSKNVTGLVPNTTYHYRAYCKNIDDKYAYGEDRTFTTKAYDLTTSSTPAEGGSVSPVIAGMNNGEILYVTATAKAGYTFDPATGWSVTGAGATITTANPTRFTMGTGDAHLTATFTPNTYTLTVEADPAAGGTVAISGESGTSASVTYGNNVTITATAEDNYTFLNWTLNGVEVSPDAAYSFDYEVAGNATFVAHFQSSRSADSTPRQAQGRASRRPRDIYPAPAREPWDWDEDDCTLNPHGGQGSAIPCAEGSTLRSGDCGSAPAMKGFGAMSTDTLARGSETRAEVEPENVPVIEHNTALYGGGVYMAESDDPATSRARLIFSGSTSTSRRGKIIYNFASMAGGGVYIDTTAWMQMKGHCEVNGNHVPSGKNGGGIYLKGRLYVGETGTGANQNGLIVNQNFAMNDFNEASYLANPTTYTENNKASLNNVCLTRHTYNYGHTLVPGTYDDESTVITLLSDITGIGAPSSIGFHVTQGFCPVIATSTGFGNPYVLANNTHTPTTEPEYVNEGWLQSIMNSAVGSDGLFNSTGAIFEDTESYVAIHTGQPNSPFNSKYIYLWGCWTHPAVKTDPEVNSPMSGNSGFCGHYKITKNEGGVLTWEIYSEEGLAWFSSYVNGLNVFASGDGAVHPAYNASINPQAKAILKADLDLSAHFWVPIGSVTVFHDTDISSGLNGSASLFEDLTDAPTPNPHHFKGSFDGQGHTIKGIDCRYLSGIYKLGLFGYLDEGAVVKNVFVDNSRFEASDNAKGFHIGGIAGKTIGSATVSASEVRSTIDVTNANKATSYVGGLVGQTVGTSGHSTVIHSSMAMPEITGAVDYMGGLVGQLGGYDNLYNSFSNPKFNTAPEASKYIGGLVGENNGTVENCYARLRGTEHTRFGYLAGTNNTNNIQYSYIPSGKTNYQANGSGIVSGHGTYAGTDRLHGKYRYKHRDQEVSATNSYINNDTLTGGLHRALNAWVKANGKTTYHPWMRTMASTINADLPILNFLKESGAKAITTEPAYNVVGSTDGNWIDYRLDANELLTEYAALTSGTPEIYLYDANTQGDGTTHQDITVTNIGTTPEVKLYINEDVGIKVSGAASSTGLKARVGVTIRNSRGESDPNWHLFSSAVAADDANIGLVYHTKEGGYTGVDDYILKSLLDDDTSINISDAIYNSANRAMDPPQTTWSDTDLGYFPTNTPYGTWRTTPASTGFFDLYDYSEKTYHWINYKREGTSACMDHWHMDPEFGTMDHYKIHYINETQMAPGKGFLMALAHETMMMADGVLNTGNKTISVTHTSTSVNTPPNGSVGTYNYNLPWRSLNLIGNPYQSYLDFDLFHNGAANADIIDNVYGTREDGIGDYIYYTNGQSGTPYTASQYIHPHQGFFVKKTDEGSSTLTFTDAMRVAGTSTSLSSPYRNHLDYPLVVLLSYDSNGGRDLTTVEVNRPELGGGGKMHNLRTSNASVYASFEDKDWQTLFTPEGVSEVPVRFEAFEDGEYTFNWETYHGDFSYLHLIDNLAGKDIDCLSATEYKFEGKTTDYHSRFKLVFQCTGVEENLDDATTVNFAFQREDELIVNGEGQLEMFDITGRRLMDTQAVGEQSHYSLPKVAAGVYLLRLSSNQQVKIQKIILQ